MRGQGSIAPHRSFADAQDDRKKLFAVILNEGCRSEGSTRSDFSVYPYPAREVRLRSWAAERPPIRSNIRTVRAHRLQPASEADTSSRQGIDQAGVIPGIEHWFVRQASIRIRGHLEYSL